MTRQDAQPSALTLEVGRHESGSLSILLDLLLPRVCSVCDGPLAAQDQIICESCREAFQTIPEPVCPICGHSRESDNLGKCAKCPRMEFYFSEVHVPFWYRGSLGDALKQFKYGHRIEMAPALGRAAFMALVQRERRRGMTGEEERSDPTGIAGTIDVIAPVPLHFTRHLSRGYNQSELLAREFARLAGLKIDTTLLKRIRRTPRQALQPPEKRYENVRGAFRVENPAAVKGQRVAVFDDILTTGHTVNQCARVLVEAGASKVVVLALARA